MDCVLGHTGYQLIITILVISNTPSLYANLRVATRVYDVEGGAIFSKNSTFVFFDGAAWTPRLRSPSPIMAPGLNVSWQYRLQYRPQRPVSHGNKFREQLKIILSNGIGKQNSTRLMQKTPKIKGEKTPRKMNSSAVVNSSVNETDTKPHCAFKAAFEVPVLSCYIIMAAVGIFGNLMGCYAIMVDRNLRNNPTTLLLLSLALSDLFTVTISAPLDIGVFFARGTWVHRELFCKFWSTMFVTTVPTSIWTLFAISVDRYKSLSDPLNSFRHSPFMTRKRALIINSLTWSYSLLFASIPLMGWRERLVNRVFMRAFVGILTLQLTRL